MTAMQTDIRETELYREAEAIYRNLRQPGSGQISDGAEVHASPDGRFAVFAGVLTDDLEDGLPTRICRTDLTSGDTKVLTFGRNTDRLPKYSPDGRQIAFLSDREKAGDFQLHLLDPISGAARSAPRVDGWIEYLHWSPDGKRILLGVAGHGADVSGGQGAVTSQPIDDTTLCWMPVVKTGEERDRWRRAWLYDLAAQRVSQISRPELNIWEAAWCGGDNLVAVVSCGPDEGLWYSARLVLIDIETGRSRELYTPQAQLGWPAASPSGKHVVVVEATCSDRGIVAGDLHVISTTSGEVKRPDTKGVDVSYTEWRSDGRLLLAGHRGFETVLGLYDLLTRTFTEVWSSRELSTGGFCLSFSGYNDSGDCVLIGEGFAKGPEIAVIRRGEYHAVKSLDLGYADQASVIRSVECMTWQAPDGLQVQGWLLRPHCKGPHPLVMAVHGGPVWHWRSYCMGRRSILFLMLIKLGYAIFLPNPRGSSGRGQEFARRVIGDLGGADTVDLLSGLDHIVKQGIVDPERLGVTGISYGGFMTSWLISQDPRFAAAVAVAPISNHVTEHLISNIPHWVALFLADSYTNLGGKYFERSPIMHAHKVRTPTLNICGALDRCTPPEEAVQFHNALLENSAKSVLVIYPQEGHGVRKFPAAADYAARVVRWFQEHMPA